VYIVENNGVYGLTKGQFSATADEGQTLKHGEFNPFPPVDIAMEAIISGCGFVARSFSGDAKQVRELVKAALSHRGTAVIDIISPCVAFNNMDSSTKSYSYGRDHQFPLHDIGWVPAADEIMIDEYAPGEMQTVTLHDGSYLQLRKLEADYNPRDRMAAIQRLQMAELNQELVTGLIYYDDKRPSLAEVANMNDTPLAHLTDAQIRPSAGSLDGLMATMR
jgi:2-oxoglutarate ferredoxin oxidoreductase subunit beta